MRPRFKGNVVVIKNEWQEYFLDTLEKRFKEMKAKNPRVSIRGFAKIAQLSPGAMSLMLNRSIEWSLSVDRAFEFLHLLKVDSDRINHFAVLASPLCIELFARKLTDLNAIKPL